MFDKRNAFPFSIVRMPHLDSNIPETIFYSSFISEFLRIARSTLRFDHLKETSTAFIQRMRATDDNLERSLHRIISHRNSEFSRFQFPLDTLVALNGSTLGTTPEVR